jgi:hypothetical protein
MNDEAPNQTEQCPYCLAEIQTAAIRCRHCTSNLTRPTASSGLGTLIFLGLVLVVIGAGIVGTSGNDPELGWLIAGAGGLVLQIAIVAWGVSLGMRDRDSRAYEQQNRATRGPST